MTLNEWARDIHENAKAHGWWDEERSFGEIVALCHSELSEALEESRAGKPMLYTVCGEDNEPCTGEVCACWVNGACKADHGTEKPEGIAVEMINCIIRILDWCAHEGVDVDAVLAEKHAYNRTRPYKHGKRF